MRPVGLTSPPDAFSRVAVFGDPAPADPAAGVSLPAAECHSQTMTRQTLRTHQSQPPGAGCTSPMRLGGSLVLRWAVIRCQNGACRTRMLSRLASKRFVAPLAPAVKVLKKRHFREEAGRWPWNSCDMRAMSGTWRCKHRKEETLGNNEQQSNGPIKWPSNHALMQRIAGNRLERFPLSCSLNESLVEHFYHIRRLLWKISCIPNWVNGHDVKGHKSPVPGEWPSVFLITKCWQSGDMCQAWATASSTAACPMETSSGSFTLPLWHHCPSTMCPHFVPLSVPCHRTARCLASPLLQVPAGSSAVPRYGSYAVTTFL